VSVGGDGDEHGVTEANLAFYRALEARAISAMERVWWHDPAVSCIHPGWHRLDGWDEVRRSWQNIFANARAWKVACEDARVLVRGDLAWVVCREVIRPSAAAEGAAARMQATNIFRRTGEGWRMIHHHASPSPDESPVPPDEPVN
jgi:ketosteroid isomerase-like protein